ncbi:hypothetical protein Bbelb_267740 [Branchiostoma belcheri]|nr:hypothetical protein Bbelb_267740 [Branchiostoma belcheri]
MVCINPPARLASLHINYVQSNLPKKVTQGTKKKAHTAQKVGDARRNVRLNEGPRLLLRNAAAAGCGSLRRVASHVVNPDLPRPMTAHAFPTWQELKRLSGMAQKTAWTP